MCPFSRSVRCRQYATLRRTGQDPEVAKKEKPVHRKKSWELLVALDNQLKQTFGRGIDKWVLTDTYKKTKSPFVWPHLVWAADEGSDNLAALHYMQRHTGCNIEYFNDPSHGVSRDFEYSLKVSGLYLHQMLCCTAWNVGHGPWAENARFMNVKRCMEDL
jgi:hypothetical protein